MHIRAPLVPSGAVDNDGEIQITTTPSRTPPTCTKGRLRRVDCARHPIGGAVTYHRAKAGIVCTQGTARDPLALNSLDATLVAEYVQSATDDGPADPIR